MLKEADSTIILQPTAALEAGQADFSYNPNPGIGSGPDGILRQNTVTSSSQTLTASPTGRTYKSSLQQRKCSHVSGYYVSLPSEASFRNDKIIIITAFIRTHLFWADHNKRHYFNTD